MHLLVPANWDKELIPPLSQLDADIETYGVLPTSMLGSGGSGPNVPQLTYKQTENYIRLAHSAGLTFNYLLNSPCMNNMEWHEDTHHELLQHLEWLCDIGVERITVAIPYLLELVKHQFPQLKVEVSTIAHVNSVARAKSFEALGADAIMLDSNVNRDLKLLEAIRNSVKCKLGVLTNTSCLYQCPYEYYHNNTLGHASQNHNPLNGFYMDYCVLHCAQSSFKDSSQFIKARWIRPEDIPLYQKLGIDFFKVGGRAMATEWIVNVARAYSSFSYPGNLHDILNNFSPKTPCTESSQASAQSTTIASRPQVYIDNKALEGFIGFFRKQDCLSGCSNCNYCQEVADKVVNFDRAEADGYIAVLDSLLDDLSNSNMFESRGLCHLSSITIQA
ncbi:U32 family peptidase [Chloroflexota bacterium]